MSADLATADGDGVSLMRGVCIEPDQALTVGGLRVLVDTLPDDVVVMCDGASVKVAGRYAGLLLLDTGRDLPHPCSGCGDHGCDGRCC